MFLEARHLFSRFIVTFFFCKKKKKDGVSSNFSNMKAYVVVRFSVANIRNMVDDKAPEIIYFHCSK